MTFTDLLETLKNEEYIYIQTHNFPDHDAVASAFALQYLLGELGVESRLIYEGDIQRDSLVQMIDELGIEIMHSGSHSMTEEDRIIIVDGCKGNKNVADLIGDEVGVIDHHQVEKPDDVPFADIRPGYGACSTIIFSYYRDFGVTIPRNAATAMMIGINMDTALLTRGVSRFDIEAYAEMYDLSDIRLQNSILRNYIQTKDLEFYRHAIDNVRIANEIAFCYFPEGCNQNLLGILGDFFLALEEVEFVILCANNGGNINFSLRSEKSDWNAARTIQNVLDGIGFGGGHGDLAGGMIPAGRMFDPDWILNKFRSLLLKGG